MENSFVMDNSVVMSWCFREQANAYADSVLEKLAAVTAYVPSVWVLEVVNVLLAAERRNLIRSAEYLYPFVSLEQFFEFINA